MFSRREQFRSRASKLESAAGKLQEPEARQQLRDLARQWRYMADGWNNVFGQSDRTQSRDEPRSEPGRSKKAKSGHSV
jgi:hypothetical protein